MTNAVTVRSGRALQLAAAVGVAAASLVAGADRAGAIMEGPCAATVAGVDVALLPVDSPEHAIKVKPDAQITWTIAAPVAVRSRELVMSFAGVDVVIDRDTTGGDDGGSRGGAANIDDYAWMGAGLYQVAGVGHMADGSTCTGAVLIEVEGNPLGTAAGIVALILTVLGAAGVIVPAIRQGGGGLVREIVDWIALGGDFPDDAEATTAPPRGAGAGSTSTGQTERPPDTMRPDDEPREDEPPAEETRARRRPPSLTTAPPTTAPPTTTPPTPPPAPPATAPAVAPAQPPASTTAAAAETPPPLPGMATVGTIGSTAAALSDAREQLSGHIDDLDIPDEDKEKLKEQLGLDKIQEKLDTVREVTETIEHFEAMGTETVDTMNRWGVNANGINGLLWLRTMFEASGRLTQKVADDLVQPVLEPVAKAGEAVGVEVDTEEVAHSLLPIQETAEEASKALLTGAKNVLGGDNILGQLGQDPVVDEEWRAIRTFP